MTDADGEEVFTATAPMNDAGGFRYGFEVPARAGSMATMHSRGQQIPLAGSFEGLGPVSEFPPTVSVSPGTWGMGSFPVGGVPGRGVPGSGGAVDR